MKNQGSNVFADSSAERETLYTDILKDLSDRSSLSEPAEQSEQKDEKAVLTAEEKLARMRAERTKRLKAARRAARIKTVLILLTGVVLTTFAKIGKMDELAVMIVITTSCLAGSYAPGCFGMRRIEKKLREFDVMLGYDKSSDR